MTPEGYIALISLTVGVLTSLAYIVREFTLVKERLARMGELVVVLRQDMNALTDYTIQRARNAALKRPDVNENSPLTVDAKSPLRELFKPIVDNLKTTYRDVYSRFGIALTDRQLFLAVQSQFGDWISRNVCMRADPIMELGECITVAMILAQEST